MYVPVIQFAIANKGYQGDMVDLYTRTVNNEADATSRYIDPVDTAVETIRAMKFVTVVEGCNEGAKRCPGCHQTDDITPYQRQTRSADEGATTFYICGNPKCPRRGSSFK